MSAAFLARFFPSISAPPRHVGWGGISFTGRPPSPTSDDAALDSFWKFSVFTDNIVDLRTQLVQAGHVVTEPVQFGDIGYLCHLEEPGGHAIELLQRTFKDHARVEKDLPDTLGLITLRIRDLDASRRFYEQGLGMRLLSTMEVDDGRPDPFDLYFFGWVAEPSPHPDVAAVTNREWLYQRTSTLVELQHYRSLPTGLTSGLDRPTALDRILIHANDVDDIARDLVAAGTQPAERPAMIDFESPDGHRFWAHRHL